ncbi:unnamed protein product [Durusdinium trenchii]|uniref:Uncharacterized protein n=1 Tax=Durusdinium trenchii TaxID=1381693 RepID=A0ABP0JES5_9DINO
MSRVLWRVLLPLSLIVAIAVVHSSRALFAAPAPPSSALDALDALRARAPLAAPLVAPNAPGPPLSTERVGFYLRVGEQAGVAIQQVKEVRKVYPKARIFVLSDGGVDLSGFCKKLKCSFVLCPPANDAWHPWPFFRRLYDAALALNTEYLYIPYVSMPPPGRTLTLPL